MNKKGENYFKLIVPMIMIIVYLILSLSVNNSVSFKMEPEFCKLGFCVIGAPLNINFNLQNESIGEICISSNAIGGFQKIDLNKKNNISIQTVTNLINDKTQDVIFSNCKFVNLPIWIQKVLTFIVDPIKTLNGKNKVTQNFRYPEIELIKGQYEKLDNGLLFAQITLKNNENLNWDCMIRVEVSKDAMVTGGDFSKMGSSDSSRDFFDSKPSQITKGGDTYGRENIQVIAHSCTDEIFIELYPICFVENTEIKIPQKNKIIIQERLNKNPC